MNKRDEVIRQAAAFKNPTQCTYEMMADFALSREAEMQEQITQLKADLATAKQGLMDYADREHWSRYSSATDYRIIWQGSEGEGCDIAQQTLDALNSGK